MCWCIWAESGRRIFIFVTPLIAKGVCVIGGSNAICSRGCQLNDKRAKTAFFQRIGPKVDSKVYQRIGPVAFPRRHCSRSHRCEKTCKLSRDWTGDILYLVPSPSRNCLLVGSKLPANWPSTSVLGRKSLMSSDKSPAVICKPTSFLWPITWQVSVMMCQQITRSHLQAYQLIRLITYKWVWWCV